MLPRSRRVSSSVFREIRGSRKPAFFHTPLLTIQRYQAADSQQSTRLAVVISQKVSKRAVVRNRLKRQLSEALRLWLPRIPDGYIVIISLKKEAAGADSRELLTSLETGLKQAKLLEAPSN